MGTEPLLTRQDDNGAAHEPDGTRFDRNGPDCAGDEGRLDEAMRRADDLLIRSLRHDEAERRRGRRRRIALWSESLSPGNVAASLFVAACSGDARRSMVSVVRDPLVPPSAACAAPDTRRLSSSTSCTSLARAAPASSISTPWTSCASCSTAAARTQTRVVGSGNQKPFGITPTTVRATPSNRSGLPMIVRSAPRSRQSS